MITVVIRPIWLTSCHGDWRGKSDFDINRSVVLSPHVPTAVHVRIRTQIHRGWPLATPARRQGSGESERLAPLTPRFLYTLVAEQEVLSSAAGSRPTIRVLIAGLPVRDETLKTQGKVTCAGNYLYHFFYPSCWLSIFSSVITFVTSFCHLMVEVKTWLCSKLIAYHIYSYGNTQRNSAYY